MTSKPAKEFYTWQEFVTDMDILTAKIMKEGVARGKFDGVYGVPRGGIIVAVVLSHKLDLPLLLSAASKSLVVDDIADTGKTLQHFHDLGACVATLYYHRQSLVEPAIWLREKGDKWVVFPWEQE